jgi:hypothetical protein
VSFSSCVFSFKFHISIILHPKDVIKCGICQSKNFNLEMCMSCIHEEKVTVTLVFVLHIQLSFAWEGTNIIFDHSSFS